MAVGFGFRSRSQGRSHERFACVVVGAADVDASGFTVTTPVGSPAITAAKTAEGLIDVTLPNGYPLIIAGAIMDNSATGDDLTIKIAPTDDSQSTGVIGFETHILGGTPTATDADGCTINMWFDCYATAQS